MMRAFAVVSALLLALAAAPRARAQESAYRFEITQVGDSTFVFHLGSASWVRRGMHGVAVDPRRRDVLVARFTVLGVSADSATALVTGQTTRVTTDQVALLSRPTAPWWKRGEFWSGILIGGLLGAVLSR